MPLYESGMVAFYRGAPAPGAPVVPTPLYFMVLLSFVCIETRKIIVPDRNMQEVKVRKKKALNECSISIILRL